MDLSGAVWRKAVKSGENGGACVELAVVSDAVTVRDSKNPEGPKVVIRRNEFRAFVEAIKSA